MKQRVWCVALVVLTLTGCVPGPKITAADEKKPSPSQGPTATSTPGPSTTPAPKPLSCDTLLVPEAQAALAKDNYSLVPNFAVEPTHELHRFIAYGGVACMWGPDYATDNVTVFAKSPITEAQATTEKNRLAASGWQMTKDSTSEVWTGPDGEDLYIPAIRFTGNAWEYALSTGELAHIAK